ncbi:hypothetical protein SAY86_018816 [Trapa natans]|uniref:Poly [ADP-ribose] polymerase n=1 Tax=Trapa natans TaxID=22666 RepID=A0AAN7LJZ8_TRANT|nr:hypothetical protein SAY86_018816 [Trapa natans]
MATVSGKPWKVEYAKSSRSSCRTCKSPIDKEDLRLGKMVQSAQFDGVIPMWNHATCIMNKTKQIKSIDDVEGIELLRWEDQQKLRKYVGSIVGSDDGRLSSDRASSSPSGTAIEVSQTSRATCRNCSQKIMKGEVRISTKPNGSKATGVAWNHANCFIKLIPSIDVVKLQGWESLSVADQSIVHSMIEKVSLSVKNGRKHGLQQDKELVLESSMETGLKRKASAGGQKSKIAKADTDVSTIKLVASKNADNSVHEDSELADLESKMESQSKEIWNLKDDLKKHVVTAELREMLNANGQDSAGSELDLRDRCVDGMLFGALVCCPICSGSLRYTGSMYRCYGYQSAWSKCTYSTREPARFKGKWKIPEGTSNDFLLQWFKSQKVKKPIRVLMPSTPNVPSGSQLRDSQVQSIKSEDLENLSVAFSGLASQSMNDWKAKIEGAGGLVHPRIKKETNCLVVGGELGEEDADMRKARRLKIPIVREVYLVDCFKRGKRLPFDQYKVETVGGAMGMVTVKVKGRSAVHEVSGLQDSGHILDDGKSIYNTTLNMSDISTGVNSYYVLQIIQDDKSSNCYLFRKWGRVGNERIGGNMLEGMSKSDAIHEFKRLFLEKTGNTWEAWESKENFQKQPGSYFPLDIDYGVGKQVTRKILNDEDSKLPPPVKELIKILFNVETYRAAMMEFKINMSEMPLGKLSKSNICQGFEALTDIQNLLNDRNRDPSMKESLLADASNRFFTMIPSIHPHVIRDEVDFQSKVKMLEALQDIEVASRLVGFDVDSEDSIDDKYKKLCCCINPLAHDSEEYQLIEKYLLKTHGHTHTDWTLELEEAFSLERKGEFHKFAPYRQKLKNRMLLWHGSRLTNFVGILSQGLRIAPPEAPATGYMFGKGLYFADMVSKSAQYCYTDPKHPVGLMILSEVALGEIYEVKKAESMNKPPEGKHSTKGLGKIIPDTSEYVTWKDEVIVPCGKPVSSSVKVSDLLYNEYIVYNTAQVKMQFLLKVRFHHKARRNASNR